MTETADVAIVGAGAAGLAAGIFAAEQAQGTRRIVLLDGARTLGAKILVSGGGRCNVTHDEVTPQDFNGPRTIVRNILAAFDVDATVRWFDSLGVQLKREETGKLFPVTDSARTVVGALLDRCRQLQIEIRTESKVRSIRPQSGLDGTFHILHGEGEIETRRVILAAGGRSLPRSGSDGSGWELARELGHSVTPTYPALVPLVLDARFFHADLAGISQEVELITVACGKRIDRRSGSLLWTHFGISGPVVMDASRHWIIANETGLSPQMICKVLPEDNLEIVERWLIEQASQRPRTTIVNTLSQRLPERFSTALLSHLQIDRTLSINQLSREIRRHLATGLTALPLPIIGPRGWNYAEVTAGGVPLDEIDFRTMQSRKAAGLFLAGEILDCDGRIGGFNFQWAWATGFLAGRAAAP